MIQTVNHLGIYSVRAAPVFPVLRVGVVGDSAADVVVSGVSEAVALGEIVKSYCHRTVYMSSEIQIGRNDFEVSIRAAGGSIVWVDRLPANHRALWSGDSKIRRGSMSQGVRSVCECLGQYRTLWRDRGQVAVLEKAVGVGAWLRPIDISEIEVLVDQLGVEADETNGESGYILNRVGHAVLASLPSWLLPAGMVERSDSEHPAGYDKISETIFLPAR